MVQLNEEEFQNLVSDTIDIIPQKYQGHLTNVAFIIEDEPSPEQRVKLQLRPYESLFGLYEGVPLPQRGGMTKLLPDKITVFKLPLEFASRDLADLREKLRNTIWHEVAHFFGLDHIEISKRDKHNH
jgi:predicted Zn-dependent protease with MMP-like domain